MEKKQFILNAMLHLILIGVIIVIDQITKAWARDALSIHPVILWEKVFSFQLVYNTGGPWGLLGKYTIVLTLASLLILLLVIAIYLKMPRIRKMNPLRICVSLITAGAVGNIIDRIAYKKVTDLFSFDLINFPVFNVADISIVCGCILAFVLTLFYYKDEDFQWKK